MLEKVRKSATITIAIAIALISTIGYVIFRPIAVNGQNNNYSNLEAKLNDLIRKVDQLEQKINRSVDPDPSGLTGRINRVEDAIRGLDREVDQIKNDVRSLENKIR